MKREFLVTATTAPNTYDTRRWVLPDGQLTFAAFKELMVGIGSQRGVPWDRVVILNVVELDVTE